MAGVSSIRVDTSKLDNISRELEQRANEILDKSAIRIQGAASENTVRVESGSMKNGWRVSPPAQTPEGVPEPGHFERVIFNTQDYAIWQEMGTRYISASPMLAPAVEAERDEFLRAWGELFK